MDNIYRILDANINRSAEGCRVIEDLCRFHFNHYEFTQALRKFRHTLRKSLKDLDNHFIHCRNIERDLGKTISQSSQADQKHTTKQLVTANFKRIQEGLRTIEENLKMIDQYPLSKKIETLRFECYQLEKSMQILFPLLIPAGLYGITAEKFSRGRSNLEVVRQMIASGVETIQYREKTTAKSLKEIYTECCELRKLTREEGVLFIINDFIDIALLCDADGVHIGQDDLPVQAVRRLVKDKIIGVSTHNPQQAEKAVAEGADYIGVGPIYPTKTKENVCSAVG
ncbi:MAG: thiamine phosphate synthase, partial [Spirochaetes bacterium]|nr:thiamine phosphate synthase [Spirochaetota bacterium]